MPAAVPPRGSKGMKERRGAVLVVETLRVAWVGMALNDHYHDHDHDHSSPPCVSMLQW
jgi:hypothetical protein